VELALGIRLCGLCRLGERVLLAVSAVGGGAPTDGTAWCHDSIMECVAWYMHSQQEEDASPVPRTSEGGSLSGGDEFTDGSSSGVSTGGPSPEPSATPKDDHALMNMQLMQQGGTEADLAVPVRGGDSPDPAVLGPQLGVLLIGAS
jgi:hypothetical protein